MARKNRRTFAFLGAALWVLWLVVGLWTLWGGEISRFAYGCCQATALLYIAYYHYEVWRFWECQEIIDELTKEVQARLNSDD